MDFIIIGAGPAGVIAAETLRRHDPQAKIVLIGNEPEPPYSRMAIPYYLVKNIPEQGTYLRKTTDHFQALNITVLPAEVQTVDSENKTVILDNQNTLHYDKLLIATGSTPVRPPISGMDLPAIYNCWTLADARNIAAKMKPGSQAVLMGAGFIGCIILEALAKSGAELSVIEMGDRMVPRMMNDKAGQMIKQWCIEKGVNVHTSTRITEVQSGQNKALTVLLDNGESLQADLLVSAAGVKPNVDFLSGSGLEIDQGIVVDRSMKTSIDDIYAAGDVAQGLDFSSGQYNVQAIQPTASEHGQIAAKNMLGQHAVLHQGSINMNVLDTLGLISSSFGLWMGVEQGDCAELYEPEQFKYLNLQFENDVLVGATSIGLIQHVGVLRGMIQSRLKLGEWKSKLMNDPSKIMEAYLANRLPL